MSFYASSVEYGLHCILWLIGPRAHPVSSRDLAELQGVSPSLLAKILPRLEKAGLLIAIDGINGGYRLARAPQDITVLDVVDAIEGGKRLFDCKNIRLGCSLFGNKPPAWARQGVCGIHALMLRAELAGTTLLDLATGVPQPPVFATKVAQWLDARAATRKQSRIDAVRRWHRRSPSRG